MALPDPQLAADLLRQARRLKRDLGDFDQSARKLHGLLNPEVPSESNLVSTLESLSGGDLAPVRRDLAELDALLGEQVVLPVEAAQRGLLEVAAELEAMQARLEALHATLPEAEDPVSHRDGDEADVRREVRCVIVSVLEEVIRSSIQSLRDGAVYPSSWEEAEQREREGAAAGSAVCGSTA